MIHLNVVTKTVMLMSLCNWSRHDRFEDRHTGICNLQRKLLILY